MRLDEEPSKKRNAFELMLQVQKESSTIVLPKKVTVGNKKDELYNDIVDLFEKEGLVWKSSEVQSGIATNAVTTIRDTLWYIDGHKHTLADRSCHIPVVFSAFEGYNKPERSKHRKRTASCLCADTLRSHSQRLYGNLQLPFWSGPSWRGLKTEVELLAKAIAKYSETLNAKKSRINALHVSSAPVRTIGDNLSLEYLLPRLSVPIGIHGVDTAVKAVDMNVAVDIDNLLPRDRRKRYNFIQDVKKGLSSPTILVTYAAGGTIGSLHWLWRTDATDISSALTSSQQVIETLKSNIPTYHTRAMRKAMFDKFGLVTNKVKPSVLRHFYRDLTGDRAVSPSRSEQEVDERLALLFELEEPELIFDLRTTNPGNASNCYELFWRIAEEFLQEDIGTAVDDRRHSVAVHVAKAISVRDFKHQVV